MIVKYIRYLCEPNNYSFRIISNKVNLFFKLFDSALLVSAKASIERDIFGH